MKLFNVKRKILERKIKLEKDIIKKERINQLDDKIYSDLKKIAKEEKLYLNSDIHLQEVASKLCTNRSYLSHAIHSHNDTYTNFMNSLRVNHLYGALEEECSLYKQYGKNNLDILKKKEELAYQMGFKSKNHMDTVLKHMSGMSFTELVERKVMK